MCQTSVCNNEKHVVKNFYVTLDFVKFIYIFRGKIVSVSSDRGFSASFLSLKNLLATKKKSR